MADKMRHLMVILKLSVIILVASLVLSSSASAGGGVLIIRNFDATADAVVKQESSGSNFGGDITMDVQARSSNSHRSYVRFNLPPSGSDVISGDLQLYVSSITFSRTYYIEKVSSAGWAEYGITWNSQPLVTGNLISFPSPTSTGYTFWGVTQHVQEFVNGTTANNGWRIKDSSEGGSQTKTTTFQTRENTNKPKLLVRFTAPWDSYSDPDRTIVSDSFDTGATVYMKGTGFASGSYNIIYYDGLGHNVSGNSGVGVNASGVLNGQTTFPSYAEPGTWHALVQPSGSTAFPYNYDDAVAAPDTYSLIADDAFEFTAVPSNNPPDLPTALTQYKLDSITIIPVGGITAESGVIITGTVSDPDGNNVRLEVEVQPIGTAFSNVPTCTSSFVPSGSTAPATCSGIADGLYHWQARTNDSNGAYSGWVAFGGNAETAPDFVVDTTPPVIEPHADVTQEATSSAGAVVNYVSPATHDAVDGDGVASCLPASGSVFPLGTTQVTCTATDAAGNIAGSFFDVFVVDTTPPYINYSAPTGSDVPVNTQIIVNFAEAMNQTSAELAFSTSPATTGSFSWSNLATMTYTPGSNLDYSTTYTVTVGTGAQDLAGNGLIDPYGLRIWQFTTVQPLTGSISGMKFNDLNGNGIKEAGEPGLANWTIGLTGISVNITITTVTDVNGNYSFTNLSAGNYTVAEILQEPGWIQTAPVSGYYIVALAPGANVAGRDFGNTIVQPPTFKVYVPWTATTQGWTTPYVIANKGNSTANVNINYYNQADGSLVGTYSVGSILPGASTFVFREWTTSNTDGSAVLLSDRPISVMVDQFNNGQNKFGAYEVDQSGSTEVFLPYTATTGGWTTPFVIENRGTANATVNIQYYNLDGSPAGSNSVDILPGASKFVFREWTTSTTDGAAKLTSNQPISVLVDMFKNSENKFGAYTPASTADTQVFIPWTATTQNWSTPFKIVNRGSSAAIVAIKYYNQADGQQAGTYNLSIAPNEVAAVFRENSTAIGTDGSAVLNSTQPISVIVEQYNNNEGKFEVYTPAMTASNNIVIPWTATTQGWTTPYVIVNRGSAPANVNIQYYNQADGSSAGTYSVNNLQPGASTFVFREWTTANTDGSAVLTSNQPITVMVDQFNNAQNKFGAYTPVG